MFNCPHCEKPGISPLRKAILSPGLIATCKSCCGTSGLRYSSWLTAMLPGSFLMIAAVFMESDPVVWSLNGIGLILMIIIPFIFAPLHKEDWWNLYALYSYDFFLPAKPVRPIRP